MVFVAGAMASCAHAAPHASNINGVAVREPDYTYAVGEDVNKIDERSLHAINPSKRSARGRRDLTLNDFKRLVLLAAVGSQPNPNFPVVIGPESNAAASGPAVSATTIAPVPTADPNTTPDVTNPTARAV
ncbi:hypothetical protein FA95DRAFT_1608841 [Auriscalpium vulgare]|uniref:Uncharacterized protein n=1 Tax=Auriscalpium vulgare TaxID=40419 RepID=A0ACB8RJJ6_9AGAM|nr:hypothetical protein FA95DRAFT_1608841 [Auriscalpium vulgare]